MVQGLANASPSPPFSVSPIAAAGRRLAQASNSGVQALVNVDAPTASIGAAQTAISNAVQNGDFANALGQNGELPMDACLLCSASQVLALLPQVLNCSGILADAMSCKSLRLINRLQRQQGAAELSRKEMQRKINIRQNGCWFL